MPQQTWAALLNHGEPWQTAQGAVLNTAATVIMSPQAPTGQDFILPGQDNGLQWYRQMSLRIRARGTATTGGTTSSWTLALAIGVSGTLATVLCTTAAVVMGTGTIGPVAWNMQANIDCIAVGSTGNTLTADGNLIFGNTAVPLFTAGANAVMVNMPFTSTAFNTYTQGTAIGLKGTLTAAFGSYQCNHFGVEQLS